MGVYIKGMEMPTPEQGVRTVNIYADGVVTNYAEDAIATAVPVPPHGRLGDLDKLIEKIDAIWDCNDMVFSPNDHCCNVPEDCKGCKWTETKNFIRRMVANAPTIIPAETPKEEA